MDIALALADALPRNAVRRDELIAVGMVATALISRWEGRDLVRTDRGVLFNPAQERGGELN